MDSALSQVASKSEILQTTQGHTIFIKLRLVYNFIKYQNNLLSIIYSTNCINELSKGVICEGNSDESYLQLPNIHKNVMKMYLVSIA